RQQIAPDQRVNERGENEIRYMEVPVRKEAFRDRHCTIRFPRPQSFCGRQEGRGARPRPPFILGSAQVCRQWATAGASLSRRMVWPRGRRVASTISWTSLDGSGVSSDTIQIARKPTGRPKMAAEMFLTPHQFAIVCACLSSATNAASLAAPSAAFIQAALSSLNLAMAAGEAFESQLQVS